MSLKSPGTLVMPRYAAAFIKRGFGVATLTCFCLNSSRALANGLLELASPKPQDTAGSFQIDQSRPLDPSLLSSTHEIP